MRSGLLLAMKLEVSISCFSPLKREPLVGGQRSAPTIRRAAKGCDCECHCAKKHRCSCSLFSSQGSRNATKPRPEGHGFVGSRGCRLATAPRGRDQSIIALSKQKTGTGSSRRRTIHRECAALLLAVRVIGEKPVTN